MWHYLTCQHLTPLIIHHIDEFVPGEAACLCLIHVEIHGNRRELNHAGFPAIDRRVVVIPQRLARRNDFGVVVVLSSTAIIYFLFKMQPF